MFPSNPSLHRRHFIIGSGPSLKEVDFDLLKDEVTWGMNRIHLMYDRTDWRPTFFAMWDWNQQNPPGYWRACIAAHWETPKFLWEGFRDGHPWYPDLEPIGEVPNTTWLPRCAKHHYYQGDNKAKRATAWHLPEICTAFSGLGAMMQLAVQHGATELILLGCDGYGPDYSKNHFVDQYSDDERDRSELDNVNMLQMHRVARDSSPIPIYSTSPAYGVHPWVRLEEILNVNDARETAIFSA